MLPCMIVLPLWLLVAIGLPAVNSKGADDRTLADLLDKKTSPVSWAIPTSNIDSADVMNSTDIATKVHFIKSMTTFLMSKAPMDPVKVEKMKQCGCGSAAVPIRWGNGIGAECVRLPEVDDPPHDASCGVICMNKKGEQLSFFCPMGQEPDCEKGCVPHKNLKTHEDAHDLLENLKLVVWMHSKNLEPHMADAFHTSMSARKCGCAAPPTGIDFGGKYGYMCIRHESGHPQALYDDDCGPVCQDANKNELVLFCPPGWTKSCHEGCRFEFPEDETPGDSMNRLVATVTGIMKNFKEAFPDPSVQTSIDCGCKEKPVSLGSLTLGKACTRHHDLTFDEAKCMGVRCDKESIDYVLFCPNGFVGACSGGCKLDVPHDELLV